MKPKGGHVFILGMMVVLLCQEAGAQFDPFTAGVFGAGAAAAGMLTPLVYCRFKECCRPDWVSFNPAGLKNDLDNRLFGQHIASRIVFKAVTGFMNSDNPSKPLVLSLHGTTGTGKNFIGKLIAENIYKKGMDSSYFHLFSATHHFPHPQQHLLTYKTELKKWIKEGTTNCERSMFIFDEVDKMHPELIDSISPYLDHYANLDGVSYRKSIFIFLSNAGGNFVTETTLDFWKAGQKREEIEYRHLEPSLSQSLFNDKNSGFYHSSLIDKNMADFFVPFLPLEYEHVFQCIMAEMRTKGLRPNEDVADKLAKDLTDYPKSEKIFSRSGCKTVATKLHFYL
ncbi:hypothetical protein INR49_022573 [Caranx melampygus]|nr:hypothetical protein INR49_022573 [Caranx melampygus]